ncbi:MAG: hypothetical protein DMD33_07705 [Gemmatimonadetes bacterium]|nr:MAG: hypothetical protein DMD33_07705 [Gemmatimonadota bacterium]PYO99742.1 MAG: hypothetical protein DMD61_06340 [Gemmatimonadota bacterium]
MPSSPTSRRVNILRAARRRIRARAAGMPAAPRSSAVSPGGLPPVRAFRAARRRPRTRCRGAAAPPGAVPAQRARAHRGHPV